jgi:hypothetical protein
LYITSKYYGFYSNLFGHETIIYGKWSDVYDIKKENIALIFPTAIRFFTNSTNGNILFASFIPRNTTFELIENIWLLNTAKKRFRKPDEKLSNKDYYVNSYGRINPLEKEKVNMAKHDFRSVNQMICICENTLTHDIIDSYNINTDTIKCISFLLNLKFLFFSIIRNLIDFFTFFKSAYQYIDVVNFLLKIVIFFTTFLILYVYFFMISTQLNNIESNILDLYEKLNQ